MVPSRDSEIYETEISESGTRFRENGKLFLGRTGRQPSLRMETDLPTCNGQEKKEVEEGGT